MITTIRWIATLSQKNPLIALIVSLLIAIGVTFGAARIFYNDGKERNASCEIEKKVLNDRIHHLEEVNDQLNRTVVLTQMDYFNQRRVDDSIAKAELKAVNDELQEKLKLQAEVNKIQKKNIVNREKVFQANEKVKQRNEQKINALKNELKK